ncbi:transglycosylase domain-containing protein [Nocardiopsis coralliicola]
MGESAEAVWRMARLAAVAGLLIAAMVLTTAGGGAVVLRDAFRAALTMPPGFDPSSYAEESVLLDAEGEEFARVHTKHRTSVALGDVAEPMVDAVLAVEDRRFYEHGGVSPSSLVRAALSTLSGDVQGGSTITQQYVKNVLVEAAEDEAEADAATEVTLARKLRELRFALGVEQAMDKDAILEGYLNISYFGNGAYGVQAAAERYFSTDAADLTPVQAALLAGLVKGPSIYDPLNEPDAAVSRRATVLQAMADTGALGAGTADELAASPLGLDPSQIRGGCHDSSQPFFCSSVLAWVERQPRFGATPEDRSRWLHRSGARITTTLDPAVQEAAQQAVDRGVPRGRDAGKVAAQAVVEPGTGAVLAMAQNRRHGFDGEDTTAINHAVDTAEGGGAGFQAGSVFKAYTLVAALEAGYAPDRQLASPRTLTVTGQRTCSGKELKPWRVGGNGGGPRRTDLRGATAVSSNTAYAQLQKSVGLCAVVEAAQQLGAHRADGEPFGQWNSFTLGDQEVSPLTVAESYATLAARGVHCAAQPVAAVETGGETREISPDCERAVPAGTADAATDVLTAPFGKDGTAAGLRPGRPAAGKTGTTDNAAAAWFAGYTPELASAVAVGDPRGGGAHPLRDVTIGGVHYGTVHGADVPGPIWRDTVAEALRGRPKADFAEPPRAPSFGGGWSRPDRASGAPVPDVAGLPYAEAAERLRAAGFRVREARSPIPSGEPSGRAASTNPSAGTRLAEGAVVNLFRAR